MNDTEVAQEVQRLRKLRDALCKDAAYPQAAACRELEDALKNMLVNRLGDALLKDAQTEEPRP